MPYSFSAGDRTIAIELGTLRKLGKARRLASANSVNRARRLGATSAAPEQPPALTRSTAAKPRRHRS
jgi:hypothetical protein